MAFQPNHSGDVEFTITQYSIVQYKIVETVTTLQPSYLKHDGTGHLPLLRHLLAGFDIGSMSVDYLLEAWESQTDSCTPGEKNQTS